MLASGSVPGRSVIGAGLLAGFAVLAVAVGRGEGTGLTALPEARAVEHLDFRAEDQVDGSVALRALSGRLVAMIRPGEDGFVRGTLRGLAQDRQRKGLGPEQPFSLVRFDDGRLALTDGATGRSVALEAFGRSNALAFARFLPDAPLAEVR